MPRRHDPDPHPFMHPFEAARQRVAEEHPVFAELLDLLWPERDPDNFSASDAQMAATLARIRKALQRHGLAPTAEEFDLAAAIAYDLFDDTPETRNALEPR